MSQAARARVLLRSTDDRWLGGVSGGLAEHWGVPVALIRIGFAATALVGGLGLLAYLLLWVLVPSAGAVGPAARPFRGLDLTGTLGLVSMAIGVLISLSLLGFPIRVSLWVPLLLAGAGIVVLWRQGDDARARAEQAALPQAVSAGIDRTMVARVLVGLVLLLLGIVGILVPRLSLMTLLQAIVATAALLAGCILIALPWIRALAERLQAERIATARAEERAAMASRVHDSVLQTLTLIQRRAGDAEEVSRLARAEERALRSWLYAPAGPRGMLAATLAEMVAATEADYDVRIELVTVGDLRVDDKVSGLVAATREAVVNAAKHAHGSATMIYVEVADGQVEVNVRDRGPGFELDTIGADRHGVRESIIGRVEGLGGRASVRSDVGEGTEVRLILPVGD